MYTNDNTNAKKGKHLSYEERVKIEVWKQAGYSNRQISRELGRAPQTIHNELKRGTVRQIAQRQKAKSGKVYEYETYVYSAPAGQLAYETARKRSVKPPKWIELADFLDWADDRMSINKWSPEAVIGYAKAKQLFPEADLPCVSTLYHWIDRGIMRTTNTDLLEKVSRKARKDKPKELKRSNMGQSIHDRPDSVNRREEFGHWEIDTVIGAKDKTDDVLLTLVERQTRFELIIRLPDKTKEAVEKAVTKLVQNMGEEVYHLIKSITADNGTEFYSLAEALENFADVYFADPYASWQRGTSENQHKLIRRFIGKGERIDSFSDQELLRIQRWMNSLPRKQFGFLASKDMFLKAWTAEKAA